MQPGTIVAAFDFSETSEVALRYAVALAERWRSRVIVVHAVEPLLLRAASIHGMDLKAETSAELQAIVNASLAGVSLPAPPRLVVTSGPADREIARAARRFGAALVLLGAHGLSGYKKALFGSTTQRVLRTAAWPVVVLPPAATRPPGGGPVIAGVDLRALSTRIARAAADFAGATGASLVLAHVVHAPRAAKRWAGRTSDSERLQRAEAETELTALAARLGRAAAPEAVIRTGRPAEALVQLARERSASAIAIGAGGRGRLRHRPGTTAYETVCLSDVPVLVV